jgi:uncharacterized membrane protein
VALSLVGFGDALYLTIDHFTGALPVCAATGSFDCAKVTTSAQSYVAGVPVAFLGLLFFTAMVVVNLPPLWRSDGRWTVPAAWLRLGMAVAGMCFVVWLVYAELALIKSVCLWCTGVHVVTFLLFVLVVATFAPLVGSGGADGGRVAD